MQQDSDLNNRIKPSEMTHIAEQIIVQSKALEQESGLRSEGFFSRIPEFFAQPKLTYGIATACCIVAVSAVVMSNQSSHLDIEAPKIVASDMADTDKFDWEEFLIKEEEIMFAGL